MQVTARFHQLRRPWKRLYASKRALGGQRVVHRTSPAAARTVSLLSARNTRSGRSTRGDVCLGWARASSCWSNARCHSTRAHPWPGPAAAGRPGRARSEARLAEYSHTLGTGLVRTWSIPRGTFDLPILGRRKTGRVLQELRRLLALIERQDVVVDCPAAHLSTSAASQSSQQLAGLLVDGFWVIGRPADLLAQQLTVA
jgi:hypothetical protein